MATTNQTIPHVNLTHKQGADLLARALLDAGIEREQSLDCTIHNVGLQGLQTAAMVHYADPEEEGKHKNTAPQTGPHTITIHTPPIIPYFYRAYYSCKQEYVFGTYVTAKDGGANFLARTAYNGEDGEPGIYLNYHGLFMYRGGLIPPYCDLACTVSRVEGIYGRDILCLVPTGVIYRSEPTMPPEHVKR